jgi:hypothetical protein
MGCIHYYLHNTCYHPNQDRSMIQYVLKFWTRETIGKSINITRHGSLWLVELVIMISKSVHWNQILIKRLCLMVYKEVVKAHSFKFLKWRFGPYRIQYYLPNNVILFMIIYKFDLNLVLININKLKLYWFIEDNTLQPILVKTNDFLPKKPVETNRSCNMFDEKLIINDLLVNKLVETKRTNNPII